MDVRFYKVECGDAARIAFRDENGQQRYIFIDAGYERTYRDILSQEIKDINASGRKIDLWVVTHIHDDHIGGVISYLKAIKKGEIIDIVDSWLFNVPFLLNKTSYSQISNPISEAKSFLQGEKLSDYIVNTKKSYPEDITNQILDIDINGLTLTILTPSADSLKELRKEYENHKFTEFNYNEITNVSEPKSQTSNDYSKTIDTFSLSNNVEDNSIENICSISFISEYNGKKILWLADTPSSYIASSLKSKGFTVDAPLKVDLVKVSHHGSIGNNGDNLYSLIRCNKFIFCADGKNKYNLPSKSCLIKILRNSGRQKNEPYELIFTHDNDQLRNIFSVDGNDVFQRFNFKMIFPQNNGWIDIPI